MKKQIEWEQPEQFSLHCIVSGRSSTSGEAHSDAMSRSRERRRRLSNVPTRGVLRLILQLLLIQNFASTGTTGQIAECPPPETIPGCPCYNFEDGLFLECAGATEETLRSTLLSVLSASGEYTGWEPNANAMNCRHEALYRRTWKRVIQVPSEKLFWYCPPRSSIFIC